MRAEVSGTGALSNAFDYTAYGEVRASLAGPPTLLGFAGELRDPSGLIYLRARWYDPGVGRFVSSDAVLGVAKYPKTLNTFAYAHGSPAVRLDPTGRWVGGACDVVTFGAFGFYTTYSICAVVSEKGELGITGTVGYGATTGVTAGVSPSLLYSPNAKQVSDLGGPFVQAGVSGKFLVGLGADLATGYTNDGRQVVVATAGPSLGFNLPELRALALPIEFHGAVTDTRTLSGRIQDFIPFWPATSSNAQVSTSGK